MYMPGFTAGSTLATILDSLRLRVCVPKSGPICTISCMNRCSGEDDFEGCIDNCRKSCQPVCFWIWTYPVRLD